MRRSVALCAVAIVSLAAGRLMAAAARSQPTPLGGTALLDWTDDLSVRIVDEAHRYLDRKTAEAVAARQRLWQRDSSSAAAYEKSIESNREDFRKSIGAVDQRLPAEMERFGNDANPALVAQTPQYRVFQVRWPVLEGVWGEGLLLEPAGQPAGQVVAIPDADETPEQLAGLAPGIPPASQFARRLAENDFRVVVPVLVSRGCDFSGNPLVAVTNQPHREWVYRQAFEVGRHVIGYEVQKVLALVDWFRQSGVEAKVGVAGYGEGGLLVLYSAAADPRIDACLVSGYFGPRQQLWEEPIYRNVWNLLREFGDAEIASLVAPRGLAIEFSLVPEVEGPPEPAQGRRGGAAPGKLTTPSFESVEQEARRAAVLVNLPGWQPAVIGGPSPSAPGSRAAVEAFTAKMGVKRPMDVSPQTPGDGRRAFDPLARQKRQVEQLTNHVQAVERGCERLRDQWFLGTINPKSADERRPRAKKYREVFRSEVIWFPGRSALRPVPRLARFTTSRSGRATRWCSTCGPNCTPGESSACPRTSSRVRSDRLSSASTGWRACPATRSRRTSPATGTTRPLPPNWLTRVLSRSPPTTFTAAATASARYKRSSTAARLAVLHYLPAAPADSQLAGQSPLCGSVADRFLR